MIKNTPNPIRRKPKPLTGFAKFKHYFKSLVNKLPHVKLIIKELKIYHTQYWPGHYYSPIVNVESIQKRAEIVFSKKNKILSAINLNEEEQFRLLNELVKNYSAIPFSDEKQDHLRYYYNNDYYCQSDGILLHLLIRHLRPKTIIEVGSGFSSALMLDTNQLFFNNEIRLIFIDPNPKRLYSLCRPGDEQKCKIIANQLQNIPLTFFDILVSGDILFIDSTHVSKTDSDVNKIIFDILPRLKPGVIIHFHDVFFPFEYPEEWVLKWKGFGWNEDYILRAFLMYNNQFGVMLFNTYMQLFHRVWFEDNMPTCLKNEGGSLWLQKL